MGHGPEDRGWKILQGRSSREAKGFAIRTGEQSAGTGYGWTGLDSYSVSRSRSEVGVATTSLHPTYQAKLGGMLF